MKLIFEELMWPAASTLDFFTIDSLNNLVRQNLTKIVHLRKVYGLCLASHEPTHSALDELFQDKSKEYVRHHLKHAKGQNFHDILECEVRKEYHEMKKRFKSSLKEQFCDNAK